MNNANKWITDRSPTAADGDKEGGVCMATGLGCDEENEYVCVHWSHVGQRASWKRSPNWEPPDEPGRIAALEYRVAVLEKAQSVLTAVLVKRLGALEGAAPDGVAPNKVSGGIAALDRRVAELEAFVAIGVACIEIKKPVPISKEKPGTGDVDSQGRCLYGLWNEEEEAWEFGLQKSPYSGDTHWLPVSCQVVPHKLFRPLASVQLFSY